MGKEGGERIARCPYCRLAGRKAQRGEMLTGAASRAVYCRMAGCMAQGPWTVSESDAIAAWNAVARLAKRGAKRERGAVTETWRAEVESAIENVARVARVWGTEQTPVREAVAAALALIDGKGSSNA